MDEPLTPVVIDGKLYLYTPAQMVCYEGEQMRAAREGDAVRPVDVVRAARTDKPHKQDSA